MARQHPSPREEDGVKCSVRGYAAVDIERGEAMTTPDHAENTGDNLRHAAEVQEQARDEETETQVPSDPVTPLPDFNT
jgi:hypothetical protein